MIDPPRSSWSLARRFVVGIAAALTSLVWSHALAAVLRNLSEVSAPLAAAALSVAAVLVAIVGVVTLPWRGAPLVAAASGGILAVLLETMAPGVLFAALALPVVGAAVTAGGRWFGERLPDSVDEVFSKRRAVVLLWIVLSLTSVVQTARLATFMTDRESDFVLFNRNPFWYQHECFSAYLYGAELASRGEENLYHTQHYPGLDPAAAPTTELQGMTVEDPYQYPPQFLLLPRLAISLTHNASTLRLMWFALQISLFVAAFAALALWVGGHAGRTALWLLPVVLMSLPMIFNFQYGQFHLPAVALAILAMLAFARERAAGGGFLLAVAILAKIFPLVLLVPLAVKRRFRELAWTAGWGVAITGLALLVLGTAPFVAFFDYHLPRLGSGAAFAFDEAWPEMADLVLADNQGMFGLAMKLGASKPAAAMVGRLFGLAILLLAALTTLRGGTPSRQARAASWLAFLGLASLTSPGAWGDYVPTVAIWLLALMTSKVADGGRWRGPVLVVAAFQFFLFGTMPIGEWAPPEVMVPVSAFGVLTLLGLYGAVLVPQVRPTLGENLAAEESVPHMV